MERLVFRGKTFSGRWIYGTPVYYANGDVCIYNDRCSSYGSEATQIARMRDQVDPESIGCQLGIFDKNGKEFYDGDFIKYGSFTRAISLDALIKGVITKEEYESYEIIGNRTDTIFTVK